MSTIEDLLREGVIEAVEADRNMAEQWVDDARRHLRAAASIADLDPSGAYVLAYDAARKTVAAALLLQGYRILSRPGSHRALTRFAAELARHLDEPALEGDSIGSGATETDRNTGREPSGRRRLLKRSTRPPRP